MLPPPGRPVRVGRAAAILPCLLILLLLLLLVALVTGCSGSGDAAPEGSDSLASSNGNPSGGDSEGEAASNDGGGEDSPGDEEGSEKKEKSISVDVGTVRQGPLVLPIRADGAIRTPRSVEIRARVSGQLTEVKVRDGERVRKGQILARIDPREYALALEESRSRHVEALARIAAEGDTLLPANGGPDTYETHIQELEQGLRRGELSEEQYRDGLLEAELNSLKSGAFRQRVLEQRTGLAAARVAEARARLDLEHTEIRAPFSGTVQGVVVVPGEIIAVNAPVCQVFDNERLEAAVHILETDLRGVEKGRPAFIAVPATGETLQVQVDAVSPYLDEASRTCEVLFRFPNRDQRLRPGMFVRAEIAGRVVPDLLLVPKEAVLMRDDRPLVFKVEDGRAKWLYVDTGRQNDDWVEILQVHSGGSLVPGDRVVVSDHLTLAHEAKLKVRRTRPPDDRWAAAVDAAAVP